MGRVAVLLSVCALAAPLTAAAQTPAPVPLWQAPTPAEGAILTVVAGTPLAFTLSAATPEPATVVHVTGSGLPQGAFQLKNDASMACYVGAGPPEGHGRHRYIFAVLALDADRIEIDKEATPAFLMFNLFSGTLGRAFLEGWYER